MRTFWSALSLVFLLYNGCTVSPTDQAGGFEWDAKTVAVIGTALGPDSVPAAGAVVRLFPEDFLTSIPPQLLGFQYHNVICDSAGQFTLDSVDTGTYVLEVLRSDTGNSAIGIRRSIHVTGAARQFDIPVLQLEQTGAVEGRIINYDEVKPEGCYVRVFGMYRYTPVDDAGNFRIKDLPPATYTLQISSSDPGFFPVVKDAQVVSGRVFALDPIRMQRDTTSDTAVVRALLDRMGLLHVSVAEVCSLDAGRVVYLNVSYRNISVVPELIGGLGALHTLWVTGNQITTLPVSLGKLTSLRYLNFAFNPLQKIPYEIGACIELQTIIAMQSHIVSLPSTIGNLTALDTLDINHCRISSLPETVTSLTSLEYLNISFNYLTFVSDGVKTWLDQKQPDWHFVQSPPPGP